MICKNCGTSNDDGVMFCTSCGAQLDNGAHDGSIVDVSSEAPAKGLALASFILGLASLIANVLCCGSFTAPAIAGIVLGIIAKNKGNTTSKAKLGVILSIVSLVVGLIMAFIFGAIYGFAIVGSSY